nr:transposase (putative), gypsy type [Tanacetum cinerariifolium]
KRIQAREHEIKNLEALLEAEAGMNKAAKDKSVGLSQELEDMRARFLDLQVSNERLSQQVATLQKQVSREEKLKAAFEEFKRYEDNRVEQRCAEIDVHLDALSIDFDEELYLHMLTAIAGRRWVIGCGLRLAIMKCGDSLELRQAFADVVFAGIAKGMSKGLRHGVEHGQAQLSLESIEAYDPEAEAKYVAALQALKDLKYPLVDQLEGLKDAPTEVIMASMYLESDTGDDAPQHVRDLRPSSSQLTIPVYPEVRDPRNPWAYKEEMLLADAIAANISPPHSCLSRPYSYPPQPPTVLPGFLSRVLGLGFFCPGEPLEQRTSSITWPLVRTSVAAATPSPPAGQGSHCTASKIHHYAGGAAQKNNPRERHDPPDLGKLLGCQACCHWPRP